MMERGTVSASSTHVVRQDVPVGQEMMNMPPVAEEVARVRSLAALTAAAREWPEEQLEAAEHLAERVGRYAAAIVDVDAAVTPCGVPNCFLETHSDARSALKLAPALAASQGSTVVQRMSGSQRNKGDGSEMAANHRRYVSALSDAGAVVYCCKRVLHTNGQCFFDADGPASGLCGRVLAVSHQLELHPIAV